MSTLFDLAIIDDKFTTTENGAITLKSSGSKVIDFFARGGAMRQASEKEIIEVFKAAVKEDIQLAVTILFYLRDIRGGQGERKLFRTCLVWLSEHYSSLTVQLFPFIVEYGRWDDLFVFKQTSNTNTVYEKALEFFASQLAEDAITSGSISLAAKWAPRQTSSKKAKKLSYDLIKVWGVTPRYYRKIISKLSKKLKIVETPLTENNLEVIDYSHVPSRAAFMYRKVFAKKDGVRYNKYLESVKKGEVKINANTLYPYDIVAAIRNTNYTANPTLELQWKALPKISTKGLAMIDTSDSMEWTQIANKVYPIDVALSLGLFLAQNNTTQFKNQFITFSSSPEFITIDSSDSLATQLYKMRKASWGGSTNLQAAFNKILEVAIQHNLAPEELPDIIYILSDMEFNQATPYNTNLEVITKKYKAKGYTRPNIIFWNIQSRNKQSPAMFNEQGVALFSGCSPSLFKQAMEGDITPVSAMMKVITNPRYKPILELMSEVV